MTLEMQRVQSDCTNILIIAFMFEIQLPRRGGQIQLAQNKTQLALTIIYHTLRKIHQTLQYSTRLGLPG